MRTKKQCNSIVFSLSCYYFFLFLFSLFLLLLFELILYVFRPAYFFVVLLLARTCQTRNAQRTKNSTNAIATKTSVDTFVVVFVMLHFSVIQFISLFLSKLFSCCCCCCCMCEKTRQPIIVGRCNPYTHTVFWWKPLFSNVCSKCISIIIVIWVPIL